MAHGREAGQDQRRLNAVWTGRFAVNDRGRAVAGRPHGVFVDARDLGGESLVADRVLEVGARRLPALVVDLDAETREVLSVMPVSGNSAWGRLPMPNF